MTGKGHIVFSVSCVYTCSLIYPIETTPLESMLVILVTVFSSLLPDIDHPKSTFGSKLSFISYPITLLFGHRGITHSLLMVSLLWYWCAYNIPWNDLDNRTASLCGLGFLIGYISHLIGDVLTPSGVPLLWPLKKRFSLNLLTNGFLVEVIVSISIPVFALVILER